MTTEAAGQGPVDRVVRPDAEARRPLPKAGPVCFADAQSILTYMVPVVGRHLPGVLDVGLWTSDQMRAYADAAAAAERERCAALCEGLREAAEHSSDGLKRAGALSMATSCAKLIRA